MTIFFVLFLCVLTCFKSASSIEGESVLRGLGNIFEAIGFSPSCVAESLATCERNLVTNATLNVAPRETNKTGLLLNHLKKVIKRPRNCADLYNTGDRESGIKTIYPFSCCNDRSVSVFCDQVTDGGGWTVLQHREVFPERENFFRKWIEYKLGFGDLNKEFWLGLENIHALVSDQLMELRVDLEDFEGERRWAKYTYFYIANESFKYLLDIGDYSGNAGDGFKNRHVGFPFSTKDNDNDSGDLQCAILYKGGWWYDQCHISNLNGYQHEGKHSSNADGINWHPFHGYHYSLKETTMSVRPQSFNYTT